MLLPAETSQTSEQKLVCEEHRVKQKLMKINIDIFLEVWHTVYK